MDINKLVEWQMDYGVFAREVLGYRADPLIKYYDLVEGHDEVISQLSGGKNSKLFLLPRESLKSQLITVGGSLWRLVRNPNLRILIYSDSATKAQGFLGGIKAHIEGTAPNSRFREIYPRWETDPHKGGEWNESRITIRERKYHQKEPSVDTGGIETSKVGGHYDIIIFDDIVSDLNVTTKAQMDKVYDCYKKSLSLLRRGGEVWVVGTRWHFGDAYGRMLDENKVTGEFDTLVKSAMDEKDGKLVFEDIGMTRDWLKTQREKQGSYLFSCLYLNSPVDDETAIFKYSDFAFYGKESRNKEFAKNFFITCTCDPAGEGEDFTAITVVGTDDKNNMYLLDIVNEHLLPDGIIKNIIRLNYKWGFDRFGIEDNFYRGMLDKEIRAAIEEERKNKNFKLFSFETFTATAKRGEGKFNRIRALQPFHERKAILFPGETVEGLDREYSELAFQMMQFPKAPHDDIVDSLAYHINIMRVGGEGQRSAPPPTSAAAFELKWFNEMNKLSKRVPSRYRQKYEMVFN